jgi:hypothetical protein
MSQSCKNSGSASGGLCGGCRRGYYHDGNDCSSILLRDLAVENINASKDDWQIFLGPVEYWMAASDSQSIKDIDRIILIFGVSVSFLSIYDPRLQCFNCVDLLALVIIIPPRFSPLLFLVYF